MGKAENSTLNACKAWIAMHGGIVVRVQSGGKKIGKYFIRFAPAGTADLLGSFRGWPIAIETKAATNQEPDQKIFQTDWERAGGKYILARGVDDLEQMLKWKERT